MKHTKEFLMILLVVFLLVGLGTLAATDVSKNDTNVIKNSDTTKNTVNKVSTTEKIETKNKPMDTSKSLDTSEKNNLIKKSNSANNFKKGTSYRKNVTGFTELVNAVEAAKTSTYDEYIINLLPGNYNATKEIVWGNSKTTKTLIIEGNNLTIDGNNKNFRFIAVQYNHILFLNNFTIQNYSLKPTINKTGSNKYYGGSALYNNGTSNLLNMNIKNNYVNATVKNTQNTGNVGLSSYGGAIINSRFMNINNSVIDSNYCSVFEDSKNVSSTTVGGAIYIFSSSKLNVTNSVITNNYAYDGYGGSIDAAGELNVVNTRFIKNFAGRSSGGIYVETYSKTVVNKSSFVQNIGSGNGVSSSYFSGGAITNQGQLIVELSNFTKNTAGAGGAIDSSSKEITIIKSIFTENEVKHSGGAINTGWCTLNIIESEFYNNSANSGGAIYPTSSIARITSSKFVGNNASSGGVFSNANSAQYFIDNCTFSENYASSGGVIRLQGDLTITNSSFNNNIGRSSGGIIYTYPSSNNNSFINIINSTFNNNSAGTGGSVYIARNNRFNMKIINSSFTENKASTGGTLYSSDNLSIENTNFTKNSASNSGGAIHHQGKLKINNCNLLNNNATKDGGAILLDHSELIISDSTLANNSAKNYGGAVSGTYSNITVQNGTFVNNTANSFGGAIHGGYSSNSTVLKSVFSNNTARYGGAIYGYNLTVKYSVLTNNSAEQGGAIYVTRNGGNTGQGVYNCIILENSNVTDNYVTSRDGYVIDFKYVIFTNITDNLFRNNTNNIRDMLFSDSKDGVILNIHDNTYIDNYLATNITQLDDVTVRVLEDETYAFPVNVTVRSIYNHTINNGSVYAKSDKIDDNYNVQNSQTTISVDNLDLELPVNQISYNYTSLNKHYQNVKTSFEIYKHIPTNLSISLDPEDNVNVSGKVHVSITLADYEGNKLTGHEIAILINGKKHTLENNITDENGEINFNYTVPGFTVNGISGLLVFEAIHHETQIGSYYDTSDSVEKSLTINKMPTHIHIDYQTSDATEANTFNVTITLCEDETTHNKITGQRVYYNITSIDGQTLINSGFFTSTAAGNNITINALPMEGYVVNAWFEGSTQYFESSETEEIIPNYIGTETEVIVSGTTYINQSKEITIKVLDSEENPMTDGSVVWIQINNQTPYAVPVINGEYIFSYTSNISGEINISATFNRTTTHSGSSGTGQYYVEELPTHTTLVVENSKVENTTIIAYINDTIHNKAVNGGTITIKENRIDLQTANVENGIATFTITGLTAGEHDLETYYTGVDQIYIPSEQYTRIFEVEKTNTHTLLEPISVLVCNETVTINVKITDENGKNITTGTVNITVDTIPPINNIAVNDGTATITINNLPAGTYNINATYNGDETYNPSSNKTTLTVNKIPTNTTVQVLDNTLSNVTIKVTTTNNTGNKVNRGNITVLDENDEAIPTLTEKTLENGECIVTIPATESGTFKIKVKYNENDIYLESLAKNETGGDTITIDVKLIPTTTKAEVLTSTLDNVTIKVTTTNTTGYKVSKGNIIVFNINDEIIATSPLQNGETIVKLPLTVLGENKIKVEYQENDIYDKSYAQNETTGDKEITINVEKIPTKMTMEILDTALGNVTIKVTVTNTTGDKVIQGDITILDKDNQPIEELTQIELRNGEQVVTIPSQYVGENIIISILYNENEIYNESYAQNQTKGINIPITVTKIPTTTTITVNGNTVKNINATGRVTDKFNKPVTEGTVIIKNGNTELGRATISNGQYNIPLNINTQGRYNLVAQYMGTNTYLPSNSTTATVNVNPIDTKITTNIPDPTKDNTTIKVNLTDKDGNAIPNAPVVITLPNGTTIPTTTDNNGTASVPVNLPVGPQTIKVTYPGNDTYKASNTTLNPVIGKIPTTTTGRVLNNTAGNVIVTGTVKDKYGRNVPEGTVSIKTGNTEIGRATVTNGAFTTTTTINNGGNYPITVQYLGTDTYLSSNANLGTVTVNPRASQITGKPEGTIAGTTNVTVTLKDPETGNPITNAPITVTLPNGSKVTGTTDNNGNVKVPVDLPKGNNKVKLDYPGNSTYKPSTTTVDVPVTAKTPNIKVTPEGDKIGNSSITTTLKDPITGNPITNAPITVTLPNGSKVPATTGPDGSVKIPLDLRNTNNNVTIDYQGNGTYNPVTSKINIKLDKNDPIIKLNPVRGVIGEDITLTAYLTDKDGNPITGGNLAFKLNGKTLRADGRFDSTAPAMKFNVKDGFVTYTIKADLYLRNAKNLTAAYSGNYKYKETGSPTVEAQIQKRYAGVTVTLTPTWNKQYDTITFTATVRDVTKNGKNTTLINQDTAVMFKVNGNTLRDNKGQIIYAPVGKDLKATHKYTIPAGTGGITASKKVRDYKVDAVFVGINYYPGARNNTKFNVERSPITININEAKANTNNILSVKATIKDYKGNNVVGTNKYTIKVNGKSYTDKNGKPKYWNAKNGVINLSGIQIDPKTTIKRVMVVTGERQAYHEGRNETTTIVRA